MGSLDMYNEPARVEGNAESVGAVHTATHTATHTTTHTATHTATHAVTDSATARLLTLKVMPNPRELFTLQHTLQRTL